MIGLVAKPHAMSLSSASDVGAFNVTFPKDNMLNNDYGRVSQTSGSVAAGSAYTIVFDLGSAKQVDTLAMLWHNLRATDTIQWLAGSTAARAAAGTDYASPILTAQTGTTQRESLALFKELMTLPIPLSWRYWAVKMVVVGSAHPDGFLRVSRAFVGKGAQFAIGPQKANLGALDKNANVTTEIGEDRFQEDQTMIRPVVSLSFEYIKQSEMEQVLGQYTLALGVSRPMLICTDLTATTIQDNLAFGRPEKVLTMESSVYDVWSFEATVTSLGV